MISGLVSGRVARPSCRKGGLLGEIEKEQGRGKTSAAASRRAVHSIRGRRLVRKRGLKAMSICSSSASRKCRGKELGEVLQDFTAQVRKLAVRSFMVDEGGRLIWM